MGISHHGSRHGGKMLPRGMVLGLWLLALTAAAAAELRGASDPDALADLRVARGSSDIAEAWLIEPTDRYRHFVLGSDYEAGGLRVALRDGRVLTHRPDEAHVFEDRQPRLADLDGDGRDEIVLVLSSLTEGASLAAFDVEGGTIRLKARTPFIGRPHRWLNPAGIADFDGDGRLDVALVAMPHLVKRLEVWTLVDERFRRIAHIDDVSNHRLGSPHMDMAAVGDFDADGTSDLAVPSGGRDALRILSLAGGQPREIARLPLGGRADGAISARRIGDGWTFEVRLEDGRVERLSFGN